MIADAHMGRFQLILTKEVSRFSRNILDTIAYTRELKALGVGVVFCDAAPYDQGYMEAADIAGSVKVRDRGGTVLQPGVELLEHASDFPKEAPLLIITDCECDRLNLYGRDHAFLVPRGRSLPFPPRGPVFYLE